MFAEIATQIGSSADVGSLAHLLGAVCMLLTAVGVVVNVSSKASGRVRNGKKKNKQVIFQVVNDSFRYGPPDELASTPAARVAMYHRCMELIEERQEDDNVVQGSTAVDIPWNMLTVHRKWGRAQVLNWDQVATLYTYYDVNELHNLRVVMRPTIDKNGDVVDVAFEITDGNHRRVTLIELRYRENPSEIAQLIQAFRLPCFVSVVEKVAEAAESFCSQNGRGRLPMAHVDEWRGRVAANDSSAREVVRVCERYGFVADELVNDDTGKLKRGWNVFRRGAKIVETMIAEFGVDVVERVLQLAADPECVGLRHKDFTSAQVFGGLCAFVAFFEKPGYVHNLGLREMFADRKLLDNIKVKSDALSESDIAVLLGRTPTMSFPKDERKRYLKNTALLVKYYSDFVPELHARGALWEKCPAQLRKLMHTVRAMANETDRSNAVAKWQRDLIEKKKARPHWLVEHINRGLTR